MHIIRSRKTVTFFAAALVSTSLVATGCSKKKSGPSGSWLVGENGLMANVRPDGKLGEGYDLKSDHDLLDIVCRGTDTAFVVGEQGTVLRTFDGGDSWDELDLGTTRTLRSVSTSGADTIYVAGDGVLSVSRNSGDSWSSLDATTSWLAVASGHGDSAVALSDSGQVWRYQGQGLTQVESLAGARTAAVSHDGTRAAVVGSGSVVLRSDDAGAHWRRVDLGRSVDLSSAWVTDDNAVVAVGAGGAVVRIASDDKVTVSNPTSATLRTIHINAEGHGLAAGDAGTVLSTEDGGLTWKDTGLKLDGAVYGVDEVDGHGHL